MNCDAIVSKGMLAWLPEATAENLDVFHMHDVPLIGTFELHGETILFACLTGATSITSIWGYVPVSKDELAELLGNEYETTQDLEFAVQDLFVGKRAVVASAKDQRITKWGTEAVANEGVLDAAIRWMDLLLQQAAKDDHAKRAQRQQVEQARADATRQVLEPA